MFITETNVGMLFIVWLSNKPAPARFRIDKMWLKRMEGGKGVQEPVLIQSESHKINSKNNDAGKNMNGCASFQPVVNQSSS